MSSDLSVGFRQVAATFLSGFSLMGLHAPKPQAPYSVDPGHHPAPQAVPRASRGRTTHVQLEGVWSMDSQAEADMEASGPSLYQRWLSGFTFS